MSEKMTEQQVVNAGSSAQLSQEGSSTSWNSANPTSPKMPIENRSTPAASTSNMDFDFFNELSKRFVHQQDQTTTHRSSLMKWFAWITASQLVVINILIFVAVFLKQDMVLTIFDFLKFFVGATFLELLGGLLIIVKFVFSHETYDMLKHLTYVEPSSED